MRRTSWKRLILGLVAFAPAAQGATDGIYRFVARDGVWHFSQRARADRPRVWVYRPYPRSLPGAGHRFDELILVVAGTTGLEPALVKAVVSVESNFDPRARSPAGALGLMQLMPVTARELGVRRPYHPGENLAAGALYLRLLLERYASLPLALAAYNAGPAAVDRQRGIPAYPETQAFVLRVLRQCREYATELPSLGLLRDCSGPLRAARAR